MCLLKCALNLSEFFLWEVLAEAQPQTWKLRPVTCFLHIKTYGIYLRWKIFFLLRLGQSILKQNTASVGWDTKTVVIVLQCSA